MHVNRRTFLRLGLAAIAAPAIVRATSLMPIKALPIGDGVGLWSISHPAPPLTNLLEDCQTLNKASLEEMVAIIRARCGMTRLPQIVRIVRPEDAHLWHGTHGV